MRICYLANASSVHTHRWVRYFVDKGHDVHVISFEKAQIIKTTVHLLELPILLRNATFALKVASIYRMRALIKKIKPDIVHAHYVTNYGLFGALCGFKPFVLTAWGSDILVVPGERFLSRIKRYIATFVLGRADAITCDAEHMKKALQTLGVPSEKIHVVFFGVDTKKFSPREQSGSLRAQLRVLNSPSVISLRNLEPLYDIESFIKSVPLVLKEIPEARFVIAGRGSEEKKLRDLARSLKVSESVKFVGFILNDKLPEYLNSMDVYVSTSLSDAGIAASTAEAMACELAVIVTDVADNRKWVEDGVSGYVVPGKDPKALAERIIFLLKNDDIRKQFGEASRKIIEERNNYYREMEKMENIYKQLVGRRRK